MNSVLIQKIESDYMEAMKSGDKITSVVLSMVKSELKNSKIAKGSELDDSDATAVIKKEIKKRREASELFSKGGRQELAEKELTEMGVLSKYALPEISEEQIRVRVKEILAELESPDFGLAMGKTMGEFKGQADGALVSKVVKEELALTS